jgi:hypothetical protein
VRSAHARCWPLTDWSLDLATLQNVDSVSNITWTRYDVLRVSGPEAWTDAVLETIAPGKPRAETWRSISRRKQPTIRGNVAVLPIDAYAESGSARYVDALTSFGAGQPHSGSTSPKNNPAVLLLHSHQVRGRLAIGSFSTEKARQGSWKKMAPNPAKWFW